MINVTLINGKKIQILPQEKAGLIRAGLLADEKKSKVKEEKEKSTTKEEKSLGETKTVKTAPVPKRPVNIDASSIMNKAQAKAGAKK